jgi:GDP-L-fucose synthase
VNKDSQILVAGNGLVGRALTRELRRQGYQNVTSISRQTSDILVDLTDEGEVDHYFRSASFLDPVEYVFDAAAKVGGIHANRTYPVDFLEQNLRIQSNLIRASREYGVKKLLFLGSSCIYPKHCPQPIKEEYLLTGPLEPTNEWYAVAKIAGLKLIQAYRRQYACPFISAMPTNLYGPGDAYHPSNSHVLPAFIQKFVKAKEDRSRSVTCWGTGSARREFLYVDDLARALIVMMERYDEDLWLNVGYGSDVTIKEAAELVAKTVGYEGEIVWDTSMPDGTPQKLLDSSRIRDLAWSPQIDLAEGLQKTVYNYMNHGYNSHE